MSRSHLKFNPILLTVFPFFHSLTSYPIFPLPFASCREEMLFLCRLTIYLWFTHAYLLSFCLESSTWVPKSVLLLKTLMISIFQQESKSKSLSCHVMHSMIRNSNFQLYLDLFLILCVLFLCFLKKLTMQCTYVPVKVISLPRKFICQSEKVCLSSVLHSVDWFSLIPGHIMHMFTSFCL